VVDRSTLSNGCVSGLKEVGLVRSGSVRSMFDIRCVRCSIVRLVNKGNHEYNSGTRKKLETLAKVED